MEYEILDMKEKIRSRSGRQNEQCVSRYGSRDRRALAEHVYGEGIYDLIPGKTNGKALGIYSEYAADEKGDYTITVACETDGTGELPEGTSVTVIPAGKYARFIVKGEMHEAVAKFWQKLWEIDLPRTYVCDYEEYQNGDMEQAEIHMYIGVK